MLKKFIAVTFFAAAAAGAFTACGGDECETLAEVCAECPDEATKSGCRAIANADEHDACESALDMYVDSCS